MLLRIVEAIKFYNMCWAKPPYYNNNLKVWLDYVYITVKYKMFLYVGSYINHLKRMIKMFSVNLV